MIAIPPLLSQTLAPPLLDPPTRAVLLMSLFAFLLLGFALVVGVLLGGRWARRYGGDDLQEPLVLHKPEEPAGTQREPAMLRNLHWGTNPDPSGQADDTTPETRAG